MMHAHRIMPPPSVVSGENDSDGVNLFTLGSVAMLLCGLWKTPLFRDACVFKWDVALLPRSPGGHLGFGMSYTSYGILKTSRQKKAAWKFIEFAAGEEGARRLAESGLAQPALKKVSESPSFLDDKEPRNKKVLLEAVKSGKFSPFCRNWYEIKALIEKHLDGVWKGTESVEAAMRRLRPLLEKNPPLTR
jgi:ABC-type glycerol-3-phosphate transport system substrate-binding protein